MRYKEAQSGWLEIVSGVFSTTKQELNLLKKQQNINKI